MRANAEAVGDGLKNFFFFLNTVATPPPPRLVNERAVRRVHQANDAVIDVTGQLGFKVSDAVARAKGRQAGRGRRRIFTSLGVRDVNPEVTVLFVAGKA